VLNMLNTLMDITEAEAGMMKLQREPTDLCQLVREVVELYEYVAEEKQVEVTLDLPDTAEETSNSKLQTSKKPHIPSSELRNESAAPEAVTGPVVSGQWSVSALVDRTRMRQVFANLLDNAIKYTPEGGQVIISVRKEAYFALVIFRDTGIGVPVEEQNKIWDRLYRGDKSRSQRGLGLGLSLVKAVVQAHGGSVAVESRPNEGATFIVKLPI